MCINISKIYFIDLDYFIFEANNQAWTPFPTTPCWMPGATLNILSDSNKSKYDVSY